MIVGVKELRQHLFIIPQDSESLMEEYKFVWRTDQTLKLIVNSTDNANLLLKLHTHCLAKMS